MLTTSEYDGVEDTPQTRKHKPAEPWVTRRGRTRGFFYGPHEIPIGFMRRSEMEKVDKWLSEMLESRKSRHSSSKTQFWLPPETSRNIQRRIALGSSVTRRWTERLTKFCKTVKQFLGRSLQTFWSVNSIFGSLK